MSEVAEVCDRVVFLRKGKVVAVDTPGGLARRMRKSKVRLLVGRGVRKLEDWGRKVGVEVRRSGREIVIEVEEEKIAWLLERLAREGMRYKEISIDKPSLEDYFLEMARAEK